MVLMGANIAESNKLKDDAAVAIGYVLWDLGIAKHSPADKGYQR